MENTSTSHANLNGIDIERFFKTLSGKIEREKIESIAAAMAESVVGDRANHIIECSGADPSRFLVKRRQLHESQMHGGTD